MPRLLLMTSFVSLFACTSDAPSMADTGVKDSGVDASPDARPDAEPECSATKACTASTRPICKEASCVPCHENTFPDQACAERDETTPACNTTNGECVACTENATCTTATASRCNTDTNTCQSCRDETDEDSNCEHLIDTPTCVSGACVQCRSGAGEDHCDGKVCNGTDGTCSDIDAGTVGLCRPCISSDQCETGQVCAKLDDDEEGSSYCFYLPVDDACNAARKPFVEKRDARVVEGGQHLVVCGFFFSSVTCEAILSLGTSCDTVSDGEAGACGRAADDNAIGTGADAYCDGPAAAQHRCGIRCTGTGPSTECPDGYVCQARQRSDLDGALGLCVPD